MKDWPLFTVAELQGDGVLLVEDGNHGEYRPRPHEFVEGGTAFIRAADLSGAQVQFNTASGINDVALKRIRKGLGRPGDLIFSHKGTVGKLARIPLDAPPFVCSPQTTFWRVLDESRLRRDYLYAYMRSKSFIDQWWVRKGETDMADYVSLTAQRQLRILVPPLEVQRQIAEPLAAIDDLIVNNGKRAELLEEMARAIYREWFVRFRYPGHEDVSLVESPLGPIPEGWTTGVLGDLTDITRQNIQPVRSPAELFNHFSIPAFDDGQLPAIDAGATIKSGKYLLSSAAVLVSKLNPRIDRVWFAEPIDERRSVTSTEFLMLRPRDRSSLEHLYLLARNATFRNHLIALSGGTSGSHQRAKPKDFLKLPVQLPPAWLVSELDGVVGDQIRLSRSLRRQSNKLTRFRELLLPKLITGQVVVSNLSLNNLSDVTTA